MKLFCLVLTLLFALSAFAATPKNISYKSGDETVQGLLYTPEGKGPFPGIVVIHEWWGLNDWVKEQASKLSDLGYVALAIDLYRGKVATTPDEAHELMRGLPEDRAKRDLHAAFEFLQSQSTVKKDRIASIGWCMGGGYSLDMALQEPTLRADVKKFEQSLKQLGKKVDIVIYPDAGHAFENPNNKDGYRPDDAADAWKRTVKFLADTLGK
jgi:carboxymethylenebutenolidase